MEPDSSEMQVCLQGPIEPIASVLHVGGNRVDNDIDPKGARHATARTRAFAVGLGIVVVLGVLTGSALAWSSGAEGRQDGGNRAEVNTPSLDGCPIQSPDGLSLYLASNRPGGKGGLDVWVTTRASATAAWAAPQNLGEPVTRRWTTSARHRSGRDGVFFVSREALPGACGQGDIYSHTETEPRGGRSRNGCSEPGRTEQGLDEQGPSWVDVTGKLRGKKCCTSRAARWRPTYPARFT